MQTPQLQHKMMEWMRLTFVHCAPRSTPPHFVMNVIKINVLCVLTHVLKKWKSQLWSYVVCSIGSIGNRLVFILVCCRGLSWLGKAGITIRVLGTTIAPRAHAGCAPCAHRANISPL